MWKYEGRRTLDHYLRRRDCVPALADALGIPETAVVPTVMKQVLEGIAVRRRTLNSPSRRHCRCCHSETSYECSTCSTCSPCAWKAVSSPVSFLCAACCAVMRCADCHPFSKHSLSTLTTALLVPGAAVSC